MFIFDGFDEAPENTKDALHCLFSEDNVEFLDTPMILLTRPEGLEGYECAPSSFKIRHLEESQYKGFIKQKFREEAQKEQQEDQRQVSMRQNA